MISIVSIREKNLPSFCSYISSIPCIRQHCMIMSAIQPNNDDDKNEGIDNDMDNNDNDG